MCDATHSQSFGWGLTAVNEVRKRIVLILGDIFFPMPTNIRYTAACGSLVHPQNVKIFAGNISPLLLVHIIHKYILTL